MKLENIMEPQWDPFLWQEVGQEHCFAGLTGWGEVVEGWAAWGVHLCADCFSSSNLLLQPCLKTQQQWFAADSCLPTRGAEGMSHNSKVSVWREGK